jgi:glucose-6-phosphate 1-epimerase
MTTHRSWNNLRKSQNMTIMNSPTGNSVSTIAPAAGGLPKLTLVAPDGARAEIYLYGAHVVSWVPTGGPERLFLSRMSAFRAGVPIRGGVPLVFPQFGTTGPLPLHGLVRLMAWELAAAETVGQEAVATFRLSDTEDSRRMWDHAFLTELAVAIGGSKLALVLAVTNTGAEPFDFTAAFHTYLAVADISATTVEGLAGLRYRDAAAGGVEAHEDSPQVGFSGEVNRIYFDAPSEARVVEKGRITVVQKAGFADAVVWNPGAAKCATMTDLEPEDYHRFVCVEASAVAAPIQLAPGERWQGMQTLIA